jgi:hypothetical protein
LAIRDKHRARWLAERDAKREEKEIEDFIRRADDLGLRIDANPTAEDIEQAKLFLGVVKYDPAEPRDDAGKWTEGGGGAGEGVSEEGKDKYGMSAKDRAIMYDWMGSGYRELRSDPSFGKVLEKLPEVSGRFIRGTRMTEAVFARYKVGRSMKLDKFSSSSQRTSAAKEFMSPSQHVDPEKKVPVLFGFNGTGYKIPRELAELAGSDNEAEVVLKMGDKFDIAQIKKVTDDEDVGEPYYAITMVPHGK